MKVTYKEDIHLLLCNLHLFLYSSTFPYMLLVDTSTKYEKNLKNETFFVKIRMKVESNTVRISHTFVFL